MIWADRLAILALMVATISLMVIAAPSGQAGAFIAIMGTITLKVVVPLWLLLRGADLLFGGPAHRREIRARLAKPR